MKLLDVIQQIDVTIPNYGRLFLWNSARMIATVVAIAYSTPLFLVALPLLAIGFIAIQVGAIVSLIWFETVYLQTRNTEHTVAQIKCKRMQ